MASKYDPKRENAQAAMYKARHDTITAQETAIREKVRADQRQRLKEAQDRANKIRKATERGKQISKYHNQQTLRFVDGKTVQFDSKKEAERFDELWLLKRAGKITDLKLQVKYRLIPEQRDMQGKVVERPCDYVADFVYYEVRDGQPPLHVVEDAKGVRTDAYVIKRKLMFQRYGIRIREV